MQKINNSFIAIATILAILLLTVIIHYFTFDKKGLQNSIKSVVELSSFATPCISVTWYESRLRGSEKMDYYLAYPEMYAPDKLGFIYGGDSSE
jgi:hypothetical protein